MRMLICALAVYAAALSVASADNRTSLKGKDSVRRGAPLQQSVVLATTRVNNRDERIVLHLDRARDRLASVAMRSGSEGMLLRSVEIAYANGQRQTITLADVIDPGAVSSPVIVDGTAGAVVEVVVWKRPSLRNGETVLQLLGTPVAEARR